METLNRRRLLAKWVEADFRELADNEKELIRNALGDLPLEPSWGTINEFVKRANAGELGMWIVRDEHEQIAAATFFNVETFCDGTLNFYSCGTVALGAADRHITEDDMPQMEELARRLGCHSMSMRTIRPGLVKKLTQLPGWYASKIILRKTL